MQMIQSWVNTLNGVVWGPPMLVLILGTGLYLMVLIRFLPWRRLATGFRLLWRGRHSAQEGDITPFNALMTALSATIGTGNIAGVATAIVLGGPGALFWMWCTALVGMATKYAEAVLAVHFREVDAKGDHVGGPMYYIRNGMGASWAWLGAAFAVFGACAGFGIGNMVQSNSVADVLAASFSVPPWLTGAVMATLVALVLLGGVRWIAQVAGRLVPAMTVLYVLGALTVLALNVGEIPAAFELVFVHAFTPIAATGGFAGAAVWAAIRFGVARGVFSNEAGLGSAPIAHAAARQNDPVDQGMIAMLGTFIDTIVVCSLTGLVILTTGVWTGTENGASLSAAAFGSALPFGGELVAVCLALFALTTTLGWSFYGEKCVEYLFGLGAVAPFRVAWVGAILLGSTLKLNFVWLVADTLNALMALPNLIALLVLSPLVWRLTRAKNLGGD